MRMIQFIYDAFVNKINIKIIVDRRFKTSSQDS